ncbi:GDSL-like lipase/acylhydrolase family protein [Jatrophihabitans sp. GAS493]|uniref:SGNH/GDSL hydrolase family protein n=1 Tax=Jatrophihabitans sp. GAS493 TaxID=1907575 RepID=UPI000BB7C2C4|nr:SGNH/GDSL hydrolase family protein [Jatrophihabitans sp. GAS493]SOD73941.1 GDSL-like lipase/acylhydrolase family protein [Jatrophihabitans sp. GAS493]
MQLSRPLVTLTAGLAALIAPLCVQTLPAQASTPAIYAVLGDSTAAGVGTGTGPQGSAVFNASNPADCKRSTIAYGPLWAAAHSATYTLPAGQMLACSGAHTDGQAGAFGKTSSASLNVSDEIALLDPATTLVSLAVGANDAGFMTLVQACAYNLGNCSGDVATAEAFGSSTLIGRLKSTYLAIHAKAPQAKLVVMGYPLPYQLNGNCILGSDTNRVQMINASNFLDDQVIKAAVNAVGSFATFADPRPAFAGHGICSSTPWINSATDDLEGVFHPNYLGHQYGYLPTLTAVTG